MIETGTNMYLDFLGGLYKVKVWPQISQMYPIWPSNPKNASFVPSMLCLDILND